MCPFCPSCAASLCGVSVLSCKASSCPYQEWKHTTKPKGMTSQKWIFNPLDQEKHCCWFYVVRSLGQPLACSDLHPSPLLGGLHIDTKAQCYFWGRDDNLGYFLLNLMLLLVLLLWQRVTAQLQTKKPKNVDQEEKNQKQQQASVPVRSPGSLFWGHHSPDAMFNHFLSRYIYLIIF